LQCCKKLRSDQKGDSMWQRFSEQSRSAILHAQIEAQGRGSVEVDTEYLLLGLLLQPESAGAIILRDQSVSLEAVRVLLPPLLPSPDAGEARLTDHSKRVLELTADEARRSGRRFIGTGHMAIALARFKHGNAASVLRNFKGTPEVLRARFDSLEAALQIEAPHSQLSGPTESLQTHSQQAPRAQALGERIIARMVKWMGGE
jgi:ATP-dependent Clp protease ATP-binding subunit ClpC